MFLESVLEENAQRKRFDQVLKSLLQAEFLRVSYWRTERQTTQRSLFLFSCCFLTWKIVSWLMHYEVDHILILCHCVFRSKKSESFISRWSASLLKRKPAEFVRRRLETGTSCVIFLFVFFPCQYIIMVNFELICIFFNLHSAFARYPNSVVVHYFCCKDRTLCPTEQWDVSTTLDTHLKLLISSLHKAFFAAQLKEMPVCLKHFHKDFSTVRPHVAMEKSYGTLDK